MAAQPQHCRPGDPFVQAALWVGVRPSGGEWADSASPVPGVAGVHHRLATVLGNAAGVTAGGATVTPKVLLLGPTSVPPLGGTGPTFAAMVTLAYPRFSAAGADLAVPLEDAIGGGALAAALATMAEEDGVLQQQAATFLQADTPPEVFASPLRFLL